MYVFAIISISILNNILSVSVTLIELILLLIIVNTNIPIQIKVMSTAVVINTLSFVDIMSALSF